MSWIYVWLLLGMTYCNLILLPEFVKRYRHPRYCRDWHDWLVLFFVPWIMISAPVTATLYFLKVIFS